MGPVRGSQRHPLRRRGDTGFVGIHLVLVMAFALYAVTMLTRTTLAARSIDDNVRVIVTEVGPGSNVSRLEETEKLNSVGRAAEEILVAARPLAAQTSEIVAAARSIDGTVSAINGNTHEITATVRGINATASDLLPVVASIRGDGASATGVAGINVRVDAALPPVAGISSDLESTAAVVVGSSGTIDSRVRSIDCALNQPSAGLVGIVGGLLAGPGGSLQSGPVNCGR